MWHNGVVVLSWLLAGGGGGSSPPTRDGGRGRDRDRLLYDHTYHAGNYADVVKHSVLIEVIRSMQRKASPMVYAETHSGAGAYPLRSKESLTLAEHKEGIGLIYNRNHNTGNDARSTEEGTASATDKLLELMNRFSEESGGGGGVDDGGELIYPGSPLVASSLCRDHDSLILCEKEQEPFDRLSGVLGGDDRVVLLRDDGYKALKRFENLRSDKRALVFVDPPYQMGSDTERIASLVKFLRTHWRSARIAIWHPVSENNRSRADRLYETVAKALTTTTTKTNGGGSGDDRLLAVELSDSSVPGVGTGMLLVNPPYGIERTLRDDLLPPLGRALGGTASTTHLAVEYL